MTKELAPCFERRYFINSVELDVDQFPHAYRSRWLIENQLHSVLDVSMNENNSQIYKEYAAANLASIRQVNLNILLQDTSQKLSVPRKKER